MVYFRFLLMILLSTAAMYGVMYLNSFSMDHVRWSETRLFMALLMGSTMAVVMLSFMRGMYKNHKANFTIYVSSALVFLIALYLVRSQNTVHDESWLSAMIPHHSIAILTSERARIRDPRVKDLASRIIESQTKEIAEMKWLLSALRNPASPSENAKSTPAEPDPKTQQP